MTSVIENIKRKYSKIKPYTYLCNFVIFSFKIILFFITKSFSLIISSLYNLSIGIARKKIYSNKKDYFFVGIFIILASIIFIIYSVWTIVFHKIVNYSLYTALMVATITFYDIGYSIYGIRRSIKSNNDQNKLLMLVKLATALISLELTQAALLSFTRSNIDSSLYNGIIGIIMGFCAFIIGIIICSYNKRT